jgi:NDP-sugar pyrophosphorylase family protein
LVQHLIPLHLFYISLALVFDLSFSLGDQTVIHPLCLIIAEKGTSIVIGEGNVIEERSRLLNTTVGMASLIEVGTHLSNSVIGSYCQIGPKCQISNCAIGNGCIIAPMIQLNCITIPDHTSVYPSGKGWKMIPVQIETVVSLGLLLLLLIILIHHYLIVSTLLSRSIVG